MGLKSECRNLLNQGYKVINDLNMNSDMTQRKKVLQRNKHLVKHKAKQLTRNLHEVVDSFDDNFQKLIDSVVENKSKILESHSEEIIQVVDYLSKLCSMAENLLQDDSSQFSDSFGQELICEFQKNLKECNELDLVDYETFTSVDLEVELNGLMHTSFVNIVSWNSQHENKEMLHSLCFEDLKKCPEGKVSKQDILKEMFCDAHTAGSTSSCLCKIELCDSSSNRNNHHTAKHVSPSYKPERLLMSGAERPDLEMSSTKVKEEPVTPSSHVDNIEGLMTSQPTSNRDQTDQQANLLSLSCPSHTCHRSQIKPRLQQACAPNDSTGASSELPRKCEAMGLSKEEDQSQIRGTSQVCDVEGSGRSGSIARQNPRPQNTDYCHKSSLFHLDSKWKPQIQDVNKWKGMKEENSNDTVGQFSCVSDHDIVTDKSGKTKGIDMMQPLAKPVQETVERGAARSSGNGKINPDEDMEMEKIKSAVESHLYITQTDSSVRTITDQRKTQVKWQNPGQENVIKSLGESSRPEEFKKSTDSVSTVDLLVSGHQKMRSKHMSWTIPQPIQMKFDLRSVMHPSASGVQEISGKLLRTIRGDVNASFDHPTGLAVTACGLLVVADTGHNSVKILDGGDLVLSIGKNDGVKFVRPSAVVCDDQSNIYVKDDVCIQIFDSCGKLLKSIGRKILKQPYGLGLVKCFSDSCLVLVDEFRACPTLFRYWIKEGNLDPCQYQPLLCGRSNHSKVRFLATYQDTILASDLGSSTMYLSNLNGKSLNVFGKYGTQPGELREPAGITVDAVGNWIVADSKNNRLQVFSQNGKFLAMVRLSSGIRRPSGIHLTSDGRLYIINYLDSEVKVFQLHF